MPHITVLNPVELPHFILFIPQVLSGIIACHVKPSQDAVKDDLGAAYDVFFSIAYVHRPGYFMMLI